MEIMARLSLFWALFVSTAAFGGIKMLRVPDGGIQPQVALDGKGTLHMLYFSGEPRQGDIYYVRSADAGATFSAPLRVNSQPGSAVASGTIRGAQIALGRNSRIHVAWNGSMSAQPAGPLNPDSGKPGNPMLYTRLKDDGSGFEPQRNLMLSSFGLDGGGAVAADNEGHVYVAWHGIAKGGHGEADRAVWIVRSDDDGKTFSSETRAWKENTGSCACCGLGIFAGSKGDVHVLYRSATEQVHRDSYHLVSNDHGRTFRGELVDRWEIGACPMSSMAFTNESTGAAAAWETAGQVSWKLLAAGAKVIPAPGEAKGRKHPRLAAGSKGDVLLVWTEGTGWQRGGSFAWQVFVRSGRPVAEKGRLPGIPAWSFAAAFLRPDGDFAIVY